MKNIILFAIIQFFGLEIWGQSIVLSPNSVETKHSTYESILLKATATPNIVGYRHTGTLSNPASTVDGNILLSVEGRGYAGGSFTSFQSGLRFTATQNWNANNRGTRAEIFTTENNSTLAFSRFYINQNGKVGIGNYLISNPTHQLEVLQPDNDDKGVGVFRYGGDAPSVFGVGARGSIIIPTATLTNDILGRFGAKGHDGTDYTTAKARIDMIANEDWLAAETGTDIKFYTTPVNTSTITEKMIIKGSGNVGIGTSDPKATIGINGDVRLFPRHVTSSGNVGTLNRDGKSVIILDCTNNTIIGGLSGGEDGMIVHLVFKGPCNTTIKNLDQSVISENRIRTSNNLAGNFDLEIIIEGGATLVYDGVGQVWHVISAIY